VQLLLALLETIVQRPDYQLLLELVLQEHILRRQQRFVLAAVPEHIHQSHLSHLASAA
jgi:hypothetical protein